MNANTRTTRPESTITKALLACGAVAGPLFVGASIIQGLTRRGFDLSREPISFLSLGPVGWIQRANFIVAGLLVAALAVGVRRALGAGAGGTFGPLFLAGRGGGLVIAGLFHPDAGFGYPPGTPGGPPKLLTYHSQLHGLGFTLSFVFFVLACAAFARAAALERRWPWVAYTGASGAAALILGISPGNSGIAVRDLLAALVLWAWITLQALRVSRRMQVPSPHATTTPAGHRPGPAADQGREIR